MSFEKDEGHTLAPRGRHIILCSKCDVKMDPTEKDPNALVCPNCHKEYSLQREPVEYEDEMVSVHEGENVELGGLDSGAGIVTEPDNDDVMRPRKVGQETKLTLRPGEHLLSYEEEIPDPT